MDRHRKTLVVFGALQLVFAGLFFAHALMRRSWGAEHHAHVARMIIVDGLRQRGVVFPTADQTIDRATSDAIVDPVRVSLRSAESQAFVPILAMASVGLLMLVQGFRPGTPRARVDDAGSPPPAEG